MKLSARFIAVTAAIAMIVVGVVGSLQGTAHAQTTSTVDLTNAWSLLTTDSTPPTGRTYVGTGNNLFATFVDQDASGVAQNSIVTDSNELIISVTEPDENVSTTSTVAVTTTNTGAGEFNVTNLAPGVAVVDADGDGSLTDEVTVTSAPGGGATTDLTIFAVN